MVSKSQKILRYIFDVDEKVSNHTYMPSSVVDEFLGDEKNGVEGDFKHLTTKDISLADKSSCDEKKRAERDFRL